MSVPGGIPGIDMQFEAANRPPFLFIGLASANELAYPSRGVGCILCSDINEKG